MTSQFKIYIDRLYDEKIEKIEETLSPDFMEVDEKDLQFPSPVKINGKAYIADQHLILHLNITTDIRIPCSICNKPVKTLIQIEQLYHTEELTQIKNQIYDYSSPLREGILLEVPSYVECEGKCPHRGEMKKYVSEGTKQFPFADL